MIAWFDRIIARAAERYRVDPRFLAVIRIAYAAWILLFPVDVMWIAGIPDGFVNPRPGVFSFIESTPSWALLFALSAVRVVLALMLAVGIFVVPVSIAMTACMVVVAGISYSFSKVDHFILFELVPVFLAFAGWGAAWSLDWIRRGRPAARGNGMPVLLFAMTVGWAMLSAAAPKVLGGWLDPSRHATRGFIARDVATGVKTGPLADVILGIHVDLFWKLMDYATLIAEGCLILFVFTPVLFRLWLLLLCCFHVGVYLTLGISFLDYTLVYAVFFGPPILWLIGRVASRPAWRTPQPGQDGRASGAVA